MMEAPTLQRNVQHRYYREVVREIILDGTDGSPENYPVLLLRLCRMVGVPLDIPLDNVLQSARISGSVETIRFAVEELGEPVTDEIIIKYLYPFLWSQQLIPIVWDYLVDHMTGSGRLRDAIRRYAEWSRYPGLVDPDQYQSLENMLDENLGRRVLRGSWSLDVTPDEEDVIRIWAKDLLMQAIERRQLNVAQFALDMGETITLNHLLYVWNTQSSSNSTAHPYFIEAPEMFRFVVANIPDNPFYAYIRDLLRQFVAALADPERGDEARTLRARIEDIINKN